MNRKPSARILLLLFSGLALAACQSGDDVPAGSATPAKPSALHSKPDKAGEPRRSPGKPSAPIHIDYEIMGMAVVGVPLSINVKVTSALDKEITVNYRIADSMSLMFTNAQARRVLLVPVGDDAFSPEQVTVIPQREGRLFLTVSAEVETEVGTMSRVMAIPIQVGSQRPAPQLNGELTAGEEGEALISMPAKED